MSNKRSLERALFLDDVEEDKFYSLKVLLPNSTSVTLTFTNPNNEISMKSFVYLVKEEYEKTRKNLELSGKKRKRVDWNLAAQSYLEFNGEKIKEMVKFNKFNPDLCNIIRLDDGSGQASFMYENMWDLTPDTDMLKELPENYSFETALADLIDNSLQALWSCSPKDRRLIRVNVLGDRISVFDTGPGMDSNSIDKWGKIGASMHRSNKSKAIGGKPPYLMPFFGMFGYGDAYASMHLGRVLSEYLGEDTMLALVCKSSQFGPNSAQYLRLQSEAAKLGRSITNRFHVLCLDATRPWKDGLMENDPQRKLAMDSPKLPNGDLIPGFKGYAVNMIDLASDELNIQTYSGYGLRETLFYGLFGNLQVYETQKHVEAALMYINGDGAVSLDGFIAKENRFIYSGCSKPEVLFLITVKVNEEEKLRQLEEVKDKVRMVAEKIVEEKCLLHKLEKQLKKTNERYINATNLFKES